MRLSKKTFGLSLALGLMVLLGYGAVHFGLFPAKTYANQDFGISNYFSEFDQDGDRLDDQSDFLEGVLAYVATKPKYQSKYYATGYPDDSYGVCTDVVAFGLKSAGYDLQQLVKADIENHRQRYNVTTPDANIDFRRVANLQVYFSHQAISLTCDLRMIDQFQGGDIVVFKNHIGVVSNKRNRQGIPYLIHHAGVFQINYEQNRLEKQGPIIGHYRIS